MVGFQLAKVARERKNIDTPHIFIHLLKGVTIHQTGHTPPGTQWKVITAVRANIELGLQLLAINGFFALGAFGPDSFRHQPLSRPPTDGLGTLEHGLIRGRRRRCHRGLLVLNTWKASRL